MPAVLRCASLAKLLKIGGWAKVSLGHTYPMVFNSLVFVMGSGGRHIKLCSARFQVERG